MVTDRYTIEDLKGLQPRSDTFVGIDSDGCVFDTMEVKQKEHFHPLIVKLWRLEKIERQVRAAAEFVNLYSVWRGRNRFPALLRTFELLHAWDEVKASGVTLPDLTALRAYCDSGLALGNPTLAAEVARTNDPGLRRVLDWSLAVNRSIDANMRPAPPFAWAKKCLQKMRGHSDMIVVSQTPEAALVREWHLHGLDSFVAAIAGQELGTKADHIRLATAGRYAPGRVLLIGDAPGDFQAARDAQVLFYPIVPGREDESWQRFSEEAYDMFCAGTYGGAYAARLLAAFDASLPDTPPWQRR